jgi:alkyl sulfatase BDS1-like metallo-beta-lactamase superfamily hydrolase
LRQARLNAYHGLFKVTEGLYQVRGYDISNITIIAGKTGYIVVDASESVERARAAMQLFYEHVGKKPILAVIYTHSHIDHWGGIKGIISEEEVEAGEVRVIAPDGFMKFTVSEAVLAGKAMTRRATYQFGERLPLDEKGTVDGGLGKTSISGKTVLIEPTESICKTGAKMTIDGVEIVFQLTPDTEAPAEMNIYFPQFKALCMAENCTQTMHNLYTLRGTPVRDAKGWAYYITKQ